MLNLLKLNLVGIRRFLKSKSGSVLVYSALSAPVLLGFGGLAVDAAFWNIEKRAVQAVAENHQHGPVVDQPAGVAIDELPQAVADLVDNSVTAGARHVKVDLEFSGPDSWLRIADDGCGMSAKQIALA